MRKKRSVIEQKGYRVPKFICDDKKSSFGYY